MLLLGVSAAARLPAQAAPGPTSTYVVALGAEFTPATTALVYRALRDAKSEGKKRVVFRIDTLAEAAAPLGELEAMLTALARPGVHTVAWVEKQALGAGGLVAMACDQLYMAPGARLGAFASAGPDAGRVGAVRDLVGQLQARRSLTSPAHHKALVAMADPAREVFDVAFADRAGIEGTCVEDAAGVQDLEQRGAKILRKRPFTERPLVVDAALADRLGLLKGVFASFEELVREEFGETPAAVAPVGSATADTAAAWLDAMKPFLFVLGFVLLIVEIKTAGFGVAGTLGLVMLGLAMYASWLMGLATLAEIALFFVGLGLIGVEIVVLPGMLISGGLGLVMVVGGLILSQQTFTVPDSDAEQAVLQRNLLNIVGLILIVVLIAALFWRLLPKIPLLNRAVLAPPDQGLRQPPPESRQTEATRLIGRTATATTDLRPAGKAAIDGQLLDVVSEGPFVPRGASVRIVAVSAGRIVVAKAGDRGIVSIGFLILLVLIGLTMLVAEVFLVSFGILFVGAALALVAAVVLAFLHHGMAVGMGFLVADSVLGPAVLFAALRALPRTRIGQQMILSAPEHAAVTSGAADASLQPLLGRRGIALTELRPSGFARIDDRRVDVVTRGEMLARATPLLVIDVEQNRVVVRADSPSPSSAS